MIIYINGKYVSEDIPQFKVFHRAIRYGDGLFETIRYVGGEIPLIEEHLDRFVKSAALLELDNPINNTIQVYSIVNKLVQANDIKDLAKIRIYLLRSGGGTYSPLTSKSDVIIRAEPVFLDTYHCTKKHLKLGLYTKNKRACSPLSRLKTCNSLIYILAAMDAQKQKVDDVVVYNQEGYIAETSTANLFIVKEEQIYTPNLNQGCISGVVRKHLCRALDVKECKISEQTLFQADAVFMTNAIKGIQIIASISDKKYDVDRVVNHKKIKTYILKNK